MNRSLNRIFTLFTKDLKDAIRDARVLVALIVPLGIGVFYNYTFDDTSITEIKGTVAISAADATQLPDLIKAAVPSNVHLTFESQPDQAAVEKAVGNEDADIGIVVPAGFDQAVSQGGQPELGVIRSPKPSVPGDYVLATLEPVLRQMAGQEFPVAINVTQAAEQPSETIFDKIGIRTWSLSLAIVMMLALVSALAIPIVLAEEFEKKTIDALVLAMPYHEVVIAKALLGMFYILVMVVIFINLTTLEIHRWGLFVLAVALTGFDPARLWTPAGRHAQERESAQHLVRRVPPAFPRPGGGHRATRAGAAARECRTAAKWSRHEVAAQFRRHRAALFRKRPVRAGTRCLGCRGVSAITLATEAEAGMSAHQEPVPHPEYLQSTSSIPTLIGRALKRQCPVCGYHPIWTGWMTLVDSCPNCGYVFRREGGYFLGGYALNLVVAEFIAMFVLVALLVWTAWEWWEIELVVLPLAIGLPILFFPFSRGLWMALDLTFTPKNQR